MIAAAGGYPGPYIQGDPPISLKDPPDDSFILHAGTKGSTNLKGHHDGQLTLQPLSTDGAHSHASQPTRLSESLTTSGGRVIAATSIAVILEAAILQVYKGISTIPFGNIYIMKNTGDRGL